MNQTEIINSFDHWIKDDSQYAALTFRQWLMPIEGKDAIIFPPTYPIKRTNDNDKAGYNIDNFDKTKPSNICQIDSVGSQANRMEPIFKKEKYKNLVPQIVIKANDREINLLDVGHRAADAIVRFSDFNQMTEAIKSYKDKGSVLELAKLVPTSLVFGMWDSRDTQVKFPRIVRSVIRAYDVDELTRSAQYSTIAGEILDGSEVEVAESESKKSTKAKLGLAHVPAVRVHGGVRVHGEIRRDAVLNLVALRALKGTNEKETRDIRCYILGLALVAITAPQEPSLREGCELVPDIDRKPSQQWQLVKYDGTREEFSCSHEKAIEFAQTATNNLFNPNTPPSLQTNFQIQKAKEALKEALKNEKSKKNKSKKESESESE